MNLKIIFKNILLRRFLSFVIDILVILLFSYLLALIDLNNSNLIRFQNYYLILFLSYFIICRLILKTRSIGYMLMGLKIRFNNKKFTKLRVIYRSLLNSVIYFVIGEFILLFIEPSEIHTILFILFISFIITIPFTNIYIIVLSKGRISLSDYISGCYVGMNNNEMIEYWKIKGNILKIVSFILLTFSLISFFIISMFWHINELVGANFSAVSEEISHEAYEIEDCEILKEYINEDFLPYFINGYENIYNEDEDLYYYVPVIYTDFYLKKKYFDNINIHYKIINYITEEIENYKKDNNHEINICYMEFKLFGFFPPFTINSVYKYKINKQDNVYWIIGDININNEEELVENLENAQIIRDFNNIGQSYAIIKVMDAEKYNFTAFYFGIGTVNPNLGSHKLFEF